MSKKLSLSKETVRNLTSRPMSEEEVTMVGGGTVTSGAECLSVPCGGATIWATCGCASAECAGSTGCDSTWTECQVN